MDEADILLEAYSPKLADEDEAALELDEKDNESPPRLATGAQLGHAQAATTVSSEDFKTILASKSASDVQSVYDSLLALYGYTLGRLQLLEIVGTNAVLTDALLSRLVELDAENTRFLATERQNRDTLAALQIQLQTQQQTSQTAEAALHDAHALLQKQEEELDVQAKIISDLKSHNGPETSSSRSRQPSGRSERDHGRSSHRESDSDRERRHRSGHSHCDDASRNGHASRDRDYERDRRRERETSVASSRFSTSRGRESLHKMDTLPSQDVDEVHDNAAEAVEVVQEPVVNDRRISINGAAAAAASKADTSKRIETQPIAPVQEDEYEAEIDLGDDIAVEEVYAAQEPAKPARTESTREERSERSSRQREHSDRNRHREEHRSSRSRDEDRNHRRRSASPSSRRHRDEHGSRSSRHERDSEKDNHRIRTERRRSPEVSTSKAAMHEDEEEGNNGFRSPPRAKEAPPPTAPRQPRADENSKTGARSSSGATKGGSNSIYGRLGLPLAGGAARKEESSSRRRERGEGRT